MKNMGLRKLALVFSTSCGPETEAVPMASGAYEIIEQARFPSNLPEALEETLMAVGTSARLGGKRTTAQMPDQVIPRLMECARTGPVACVFGRESRGLTNEELKLCTDHMIIPTNAEFASMNVAHAAAITAYEIFKIACRPVGFQAKKMRPASIKVREDMYEHVESVLLQAGFLDRSNPLRMMRDLRRILNSADMGDRDAKIIRGIFRKIGNMMRIAREKAGQIKCSEVEI
jgi:TrmH family RNA methyltransferase